MIWSAFDGYDYQHQVDYLQLWARVVAAFREICDALPDVRVSLEFKPTDENTCAAYGLKRGQQAQHVRC